VKENGWIVFKEERTPFSENDWDNPDDKLIDNIRLDECVG
jgi:hypothetical protein